MRMHFIEKEVSVLPKNDFKSIKALLDPLKVLLKLIAYLLAFILLLYLIAFFVYGIAD